MPCRFWATKWAMSNIQQHRISRKAFWRTPIPWVSLIVLSGVCALLYHAHMKRQARAALAQKVQKVRESVGSLEKRYDAVEVPVQSPGVFSANYADMLIRGDHRPVVFLGAVEDVGRNGDQYVLLLDSYEPVPRTLQFSLIADAGKAQQVMRAGVETRWAIVANVSSVSSQGGPLVGDGVFAQGTCIDLVQLDGDLLGHYVFADPAER